MEGKQIGVGVGNLRILGWMSGGRVVMIEEKRKKSLVLGLNLEFPLKG